LHASNVRKTRLLYHHKPFPLEIRTLGDLLMVRRKQAGIPHRELSAKTGIKLHWLRRWEFDRAVPSQSQWDQLRQFVDLPPKPVLTFAQYKTPEKSPISLGSQLRKKRLERKLCLAEAALILGVSVPTLGLWELDRVFPKSGYHSRVSAFLGYNPFP
jgi:transcriptional regulator with XRE-family HTH domain